VHSLYLMTMGVLAVRGIHSASGVSRSFSATAGQPYRNRKLGEQSLQAVTDAATASTKPQIHRIYLHVQSNNDDAIRFYERHGFVKKELVQDYYKRLQPRDAWILERVLPAPSS
jgi:RimJ/RimL family protein N-acetyltransferase